MRPPSAVLDRLNRLRLLPAPTSLSLRPGERRSVDKGAGLEFAGHRPYRIGDDLRHLDARLYARFRTPFLREYLADRQLRVAILADTSASMDFGTPSKRDMALMLAGLLGYAALSSSDLVQVGLARDERIDWSDAIQGSSRAEALFGWIETGRRDSSGSFSQQIKAALPRLKQANLVILISDWWLDDPEPDLRLLAELPCAIFGLDISASEEDDPLLLGKGPMRLREAETGTDFELTIDNAGIAEYRHLLELHRDAIRAQLQRFGGHYVQLRADMSASDALATLVRADLLGQYGATRAANAQGPGVPA